MGNSKNHRKSKSGLSSKNAGKVSLESNEEFASYATEFFLCFVLFFRGIAITEEPAAVKNRVFENDFFVLYLRR